MPDRVVLLLDGGFVTKILRARMARHALAADVVALKQDILAKPPVRPMALLRVYYTSRYDVEASS